MFVCTFITTAAFFGVINDDDDDDDDDDNSAALPSSLAVIAHYTSPASDACFTLPSEIKILF